jgi:hypothetical protein
MSASSSAPPGAPPPATREGPARDSLAAQQLACAALAALLALQVMLPAAGPPPQIAFLAARRPRPVLIPPLPEYPAILRAPLFAPDRRPGEPVAAAGTAGGGALEGYAALGVVVGRGLAAAMISGPNVAARAVRRGEIVDGWRLTAISTEAVTFEHAGARRTLIVGAPALAPAAGAPDAPQTPPQGALQSPLIMGRTK